jgi:hypothetical protein
MRSLLLVFSLFLSLTSSASIWFVKANASGANTGTSWGDAFTDLQSALGACTFGDEIWVAAGTYKPTTGNSSSVYFNLINGVKLYGGFSGTESSLSERDYVANVTTLSGNVGNSTSAVDNSNHVIWGLNVGSFTRLDGFRITEGHASTSGGAIYLSSSSPVIANCNFVNNYASDGGGALVHDGGTLVVNNCTFLANSTNGYGGAIKVVSGTARFTDSKFTSNQAATCGGAFYLYGGETFIDRCTIDGNSAESNSGAIYHYNESSMNLTNSLIVGNYAPRISIMYIAPLSNGNPHDIVNCTFANNRQTQNTGLEYPIVVNSLTNITNSVFWDNGGAGAMYPNASPSYCVIQGGFSGGFTISSANPQFSNPGSSLNAPFVLDGILDYRPSNAPSSPLIDQGDNTEVLAPALFDLDNTPRIHGNYVDIGAYEEAYCFVPVAIVADGEMPFCPSTAHLLSVSTGDDFTWKLGASVIGTSFNQLVSNPGSYSVSIYTLDGCRAYDTLAVSYSTAGFQISGTTYFCPNSSTVLSISGNYSNPIWNSISSSDSITINTEGPVSLTALSTSGCEVTLTTNVTEATTPQTSISLIGTQLRAGAGFAAYQWYFNGQAISGATQLNYTPTANGNYTVEITSISGCSNFSPVYVFDVLSIHDIQNNIAIYPNPFNTELTISGLTSNMLIRVMDITGRKVFEQQLQSNATIELNTTALNNGIYVLMLLDSEENVLSASRIICQH